MNHAYIASLWSSDLSRQVGAAIADDDGNLLTTGSNEVPHSSGGFNWSNVHAQCDQRDFKQCEDINYQYKESDKQAIISNFQSLLQNSNLLSNDIKNIIEKHKSNLFNNTILRDLIEFGRSVHAEQAAICNAARKGIPIQNQIMYITTYPCHLCFKQIIGAGIKRVIYIEPYPKSQADVLHEYAIKDDKCNNKCTHYPRITIDAFTGVAPKRFIPAYKMDQREIDGKLHLDLPRDAEPKRIKQAKADTHAIRELKACTKLYEHLDEKGLDEFLPEENSLKSNLKKAKKLWDKINNLNMHNYKK
jgi:cytidine deaminase